MKSGDKMFCEVITGQGKGTRVPVLVVEVKFHWIMPNSVQRVRVKVLRGKAKWIWVQPQYLHKEEI